MLTSGRLGQTTIVGLALALVGAVAMIASFDIKPDPDGGWGARIFPLFGAGILFGLGLIEAFGGMRDVSQTASPARNILPVLVLLAVALAYVWLIGRVGYLLSTGIVAPLVLVIFGSRSPLVLVAAAVLCPAAYHLIFFIGLGVFPPYGAWFDLLDVIQGY